MTYAPTGLQGELVTVEVAARPGLSSLTFVGLAGRAVAESKERIRIALRCLGIPLPTTAVVVNLAPAELIKNGTHYDLPIALALLLAMGEIPADVLPPDTIVAGELGLDGQLRRLRQAVSFSSMAQKAGYPVLLPRVVQPEVALTRHRRVALYPGLKQLVENLRERTLRFVPAGGYVVSQPNNSIASEVTFDDISGQELAKRALTIALAGRHHLMLVGSPGAGKSLLVEAAASLQPPLTAHERLECTSIYSAAGLLTDEQPMIARAPFRSPHHRSSVAAMIGGGAVVRPGELSLAHRGVLFLDELPHFNPLVLESLREPMQRRVVSIKRVNGGFEYPSDFLLAAAFNPCPCGWAGDRQNVCRCAPSARAKYLSHLSGPISDRFSLFVRCEGLRSLERPQSARNEHREARQTVSVARSRQRQRQGCLNGELKPGQLSSYLENRSWRVTFDKWLQQGRSMRQLHQAVRVALTIADLEGVEMGAMHLAEAWSLLPPRDLISS